MDLLKIQDMTILLFANKLIYGGGERVRNWLSHNLVDAGHTVILATSHMDDQYNEELQKLGLYNKVKVVKYPSEGNKKSFLRYCKSIKALFREYHIDLFVTFCGSLIEQFIARKAGVKILITERCDPFYRTKLEKIIKHLEFKLADGYVFQTPQAMEYYGKRAKQLGVVIPNPILDKSPDPIFTNLRKEIVSVGRLSPEKNQMMLLKAFAKIHNQIPEYKLVLYGSGPLKEQLIRFSEENGIAGKFEIISGKTNITELINGAELFVLSSNTEGMPNALIEAMSMGLLSISTDCPIYGPRFLVNNGENAYLVPVNDDVKLATQIVYLLKEAINNSEVRHNAVMIRQRLNSDIIFNQWLSYIESIV